MNKLTDQQIQEILDAQVSNRETTSSPIPGGEEIQVYKRLFDGLSTEPADMFLPYSFAANVARTAQRKAYNILEIKTFFFYTLGICIASLIAISILYIAPAHAYVRLEKGFLRLAVPLLFTLMGFGLIQLADYWLVKRVKS